MPLYTWHPGRFVSFIGGLSFLDKESKAEPTNCDIPDPTKLCSSTFSSQNSYTRAWLTLCYRPDDATHPCLFKTKFVRNLRVIERVKWMKKAYYLTLLRKCDNVQRSLSRVDEFFISKKWLHRHPFLKNLCKKFYWWHFSAMLIPTFLFFLFCEQLEIA